jgi:hypothetical protein
MMTVMEAIEVPTVATSGVLCVQRPGRMSQAVIHSTNAIKAASRTVCPHLLFGVNSLITWAGIAVYETRNEWNQRRSAVLKCNRKDGVLFNNHKIISIPCLVYTCIGSSFACSLVGKQPHSFLLFLSALLNILSPSSFNQT